MRLWQEMALRDSSVPPTGFKLGQPPTYYNLSTTATYSSPITICINYSGISFTNQNNIAIWHYDPVPNQNAPSNHRISSCGQSGPQESVVVQFAALLCSA